MQSQSSTNMFSDYLLWWQLNWFDDVKSLIDGAFYKMSWSKRSFANTFFFIVKFPSIHLSYIRPTDTKLITDGWIIKKCGYRNFLLALMNNIMNNKKDSNVDDRVQFPRMNMER